MALEPSTATSVPTNPTFLRCIHHNYPPQRRIRWTDQRPSGPSRMRNKWRCASRTTLCERRLKNPAFAAEQERSGIILFNSDQWMKVKQSFTNVQIASTRGASTIRRSRRSVPYWYDMLLARGFATACICYELQCVQLYLSTFLPIQAIYVVLFHRYKIHFIASKRLCFDLTRSC
jgi:hypothetical protein